MAETMLTCGKSRAVARGVIQTQSTWRIVSTKPIVVGSNERPLAKVDGATLSLP